MKCKNCGCEIKDDIAPIVISESEQCCSVPCAEAYQNKLLAEKEEDTPTVFLNG